MRRAFTWERPTSLMQCRTHLIRDWRSMPQSESFTDRPNNILIKMHLTWLSLCLPARFIATAYDCELCNARPSAAPNSEPNWIRRCIYWCGKFCALHRNSSFKDNDYVHWNFFYNWFLSFSYKKHLFKNVKHGNFSNDSKFLREISWEILKKLANSIFPANTCTEWEAAWFQCRSFYCNSMHTK